ncbi:MAG: hypothetical protein WC749_04765 [Dehalococcoidia bacterium]
MLKNVIGLIMCLVLVIITGVALAQSEKGSGPAESAERIQSETEPMQSVGGIPTCRLTDIQKEYLKGIVFSDKDVVDIIDDREYEIVSTGCWIQGEKHDKVGGFIQIAFHEAFVEKREWPAVSYGYEDREYASEELEIFSRGDHVQYREYAEAKVRQLNIRVDFRTGKVASIMPLPWNPEPKHLRAPEPEDSKDCPTIYPTTVSLGDSDYTYNWDSDYDNYPSSTNLDMPVTMLFWDDAEIDAVKSIYYGTSNHTTMYLWFKDDGSYESDSDKGTTDDSLYYEDYRAHLRLYADYPDDYNTNSSLGHYVIGTTHYDYEGPGDDAWGWSDTAAWEFAYIAENQGYDVAYDDTNINFLNNISCTTMDGQYYYYCDGYVDKVQFP